MPDDNRYRGSSREIQRTRLSFEGPNAHMVAMEVVSRAYEAMYYSKIEEMEAKLELRKQEIEQKLRLQQLQLQQQQEALHQQLGLRRRA